MKNLFAIFIILGLFIPGYSFAAMQDIHIEWSYDTQPVEGKTLAGYHLYKEGVETCTTTSPTDTSMDCTFDSEDGTFQFTLTAFYTDGYESPHSSPYTFTLTTQPAQELQAAIATTPTSLSGDIPFTISFNAASSTGEITSYSWNYGDNHSDTGSQVTHTYAASGTFQATLTVTDSQGSTSQKTVVITANTPQPYPSAHDIHIVWEYNFQPDDGRTLAGYYLYKEGEKICTSNSPTDKTMDCTFQSEDGTFNFTLTAFCTDGYESPHSAPYTFTLGTTSEPNLHALFDTDPLSLTGEAPFTVNFDATSSTGDITSYSWTFGDNNSVSGSQLSHTFSSPGTYQTTLTVTSSTGAISQQTATVTATAPPEPPVAIISPATFSGNAPLTVVFNGSSSTNATVYSWAFGDGTTSSAGQVNHTFSNPGIYTTTLTVTNEQGQTNSTNVTITANDSTPLNTAPTAIISSSTAMGEAPLVVSFIGSESHDAEGAINSYLWNFGDGSQTATGPTTSHKYTIAGTFSASLTVTDNQGATDTTATPVIVTGQSVENQPPTARLTASATEGSTPLEVTFDGSASTDPENSSLSYNWNFGDGAVAQGVTANHSYTIPGSFTASLTVTDEMGATSSITTIINTEGTPQFQIELGEVEIDHNWIRVNFSDPFINPIVVAGAPSNNDSSPCVVRLRNITTTGFDIRIQEWDYEDNTHAKETVAYLVLQQGSFTLDDGTMVEAGKFYANNTNLQTVPFSKAFTTVPVVMSSVATFNEINTVTSRLCNISTASFDFKMQGQESLHTHGPETGNYIAWESSKTSIDNLNILVNKTADKVRNRWYTVDFGEKLSTQPIFLGTMQSLDGIDTSAIRYKNMTNSEIQLHVEEEKSADTETRHTSETVGYFLFSDNSDTTPPNENEPPTAVISASVTSGPPPLQVTFDASESTDDGEIVSYLWDFGDGTTGSGATVNHTY